MLLMSFFCKLVKNEIHAKAKIWLLSDSKSVKKMNKVLFIVLFKLGSKLIKKHEISFLHRNLVF